MKEKSAGLPVFFLCMLSSLQLYAATQADSQITTQAIRQTEKVIGLHFTAAQRKQMLESLKEHRRNFTALREVPLNNATPPAMRFMPEGLHLRVAGDYAPAQWTNLPAVQLPSTQDQLAWMSAQQLSALVHQRKISAVQLARFFLDRLQRYGPELHAVITLMRKQALSQAAKIDRAIAAGRDPGPLAGVPYGVKDLFAVAGTRTTWGAAPYKHQVINRTATVVRRLNAAGAVLVAKLSMGALAMGDVWYGGKTRNPWNLEQGSSGSSAGPAAAVSAGLVPFAIGTETYGSIVSPATRVGITGLRPTYGRVSRDGAMTLSWSMDKVGPLCREVEDCARVFSIIQGYDPADPSTVDAPFPFRPEIDLRKLRIGYLKDAFARTYPGHDADQKALATLRKLGVKLVPVKLPALPIQAMGLVIDVESAAAFDILTRSHRDALLVRQDADAWPNIFRVARFIPAVEYLQANRVRTLLMRRMTAIMQNVDVYLAPSSDDRNLLATNLTGQPTVVLPDGFKAANAPVSISFVGRLYGDATVLEVARAFQQVTDFDKQHPPGFK